MNTCANCKYSEPIGGGLACVGQKGMPFVNPSESCESWKTKKNTNYDRIISKSPEELATTIASSIDCNICQETFGRLPCDGRSCTNVWLEWLRQEVKEAK